MREVSTRAVSAAARRDLQWQDCQLQQVQGTSLWRDFTSSVVIVTDEAMDQTASAVEGPLGFGAVCFAPETVSVMQHRWDTKELQWFASVSDSSTLREVYAAFMAALHWQQKFAPVVDSERRIRPSRPVLFVVDSSSVACIMHGCARTGADSALTKVCLAFSDLMAACGSPHACWWCPRDDPALRAVDYLSRTNAHEALGRTTVHNEFGSGPCSGRAGRAGTCVRGRDGARQVPSTGGSTSSFAG